MSAHLRTVWLPLVILLSGYAQTPPAQPLAILSKELPAASLWQPYAFHLDALGGVGPYHWRVTGGSLPHGWILDENGDLKGVAQGIESVALTVLLTDSNNPAASDQHKFILNVESPLRVLWGRTAHVVEKKILGSVKLSNGTGRNFDLTLIVLAVNDTGRATAIGYQHFALKKHTRDLEVPFGDVLSPGNYAVNVDAIGEEPVSKRIFRARLVSKTESLSEGP
ncbi:MAG: hypothetical protein JO159_04935 [Acidobacteria bacterium]|nr:hypothetical protein [Acidobacteriota bacterium]